MLTKPPIDAEFKYPNQTKSRTVDFTHGHTLIRRLEEAGFAVVKVIKTDTTCYVEWTWEVKG